MLLHLTRDFALVFKYRGNFQSIFLSTIIWNSLHTCICHCSRGRWYQWRIVPSPIKSLKFVHVKNFATLLFFFALCIAADGHGIHNGPCLHIYSETYNPYRIYAIQLITFLPPFGGVTIFCSYKRRASPTAHLDRRVRSPICFEERWFYGYLHANWTTFSSTVRVSGIFMIHFIWAPLGASNWWVHGLTCERAREAPGNFWLT